MGEQPDPHMYTPDNRAFYLTSTLSLLYTSHDLCTWPNAPMALFNGTDNIADLWAPQVRLRTVNPCQPAAAYDDDDDDESTPSPGVILMRLHSPARVCVRNPQIVSVGGRTVVTVTARLPWLCQDPIITCRTSYYAVLSRPLPAPGLSLRASGWVPIRASELRQFRTALTCPHLNALPRSFAPGAVISRRDYIGIDTDIWTDPLTNEVWLSWSSDDNVPMSGGVSVQAIGIARLDPGTLEIICDPSNTPIMPVRALRERGERAINRGEKRG